MPTSMTSKGQVTIPGKVLEALHLAPGDGVEFNVNREGQVMVMKAGSRRGARKDRFTTTIGKVQVKWRTDELMALVRAVCRHTAPVTLDALPRVEMSGANHKICRDG